MFLKNVVLHEIYSKKSFCPYTFDQRLYLEITFIRGSHFSCITHKIQISGCIPNFQIHIKYWSKYNGIVSFIVLFL